MDECKALNLCSQDHQAIAYTGRGGCPLCESLVRRRELHKEKQHSENEIHELEIKLSRRGLRHLR